jgi:CheY-like chemotaxis protein
VRTRPTILFFGPVGEPVPDLVREWALGRSFPLEVHADPAQVESIVLRGHPCLLFIDADRMGQAGLQLVRGLKSDPFTAIIPALILAGSHDADEIQGWFGAGADEILTGLFPLEEQRARLDALLVRTQRDVSVHPSTRMPGTTEIEREIRRRLEGTQEFAVCYADLDHFKEYNDRYSYYDGDRVIYILSRILHDVVKGLLGGGVRRPYRRRTILSSSSRRPTSARSAERYSRCSIHWCRSSTTSRTAAPDISSARIGAGSAPGAAHDAFGWHRDEPSSHLCPSGRSERAGHRDEELRQDAAGSVYVVDRRQGRSDEERASGAPSQREAAGETS